MKGGGVFPAASPFSLLSSIFIEWPVRLQQHAGLTRRSANGWPPASSTSCLHPPDAGPKKIEFSPPTPPLLTQHYKVWQPVQSLFLVESDKGEVAVAGAADGGARGVTFSRSWRAVRITEADDEGGGGGVIRGSVPYATHPPSFFLLFPHPQSLRRPCLRGRRGSSTIANGSAAEWWRGVMKPITTPINLKTARYLK